MRQGNTPVTLTQNGMEWKVFPESQPSRMSLEENTVKLNRVTDESLESTRRMVQMTDECLNVGAKTMTMLDEQGEKLDNLRKEMDHINEDMKLNQENLDKLSKSCFPWMRFIKRDRKYKQGRKPKESKHTVVSSHPTATHNAVSAGSAPPSGPYIKRITNDGRENEIEGTLREVDKSIARLKSMALEIGHWITQQTEDITELTDEVENATAKVSAAEKQARKHC